MPLQMLASVPRMQSSTQNIDTRDAQAMSREGTRLLKLMGFETKGLQSNIGLEQEFFFIPRDAFARRLDLQLTGRTVMGKNAVRLSTSQLKHRNTVQ